MAQSTPVFSPKEDALNDDSPETASGGRGCFGCWNFPCFNPRQSNNWERISTSEKEQHENNDESWWDKGISTLKKIREWSELVAGPKWKTFIRRFNKTTGRSKPGKFHYDAFSYALNFDEGPAQNGQSEDDWFFRNFSSRYVAIPAQNGASKEGSGGALSNLISA